MLGALCRLVRVPRDPPGRQPRHVENIYCWSDLCRYIYPYTHTMFSDIYLPPIVHRPNPPETSHGPCAPPHATSLPPGSLPRPHEAPMPPGLPQPPFTNWSTVLPRDAQHTLADWSIVSLPCAAAHAGRLVNRPSAARRPTHAGRLVNCPRRLYDLPPSRLRPRPAAAAAAQPAKATQPTGSPSPPCRRSPRRGAPVAPPCNPRAAWRGLSPRGEVLDHPARAGVAHNGPPETPPCRCRAPALTLRACQPPAVPPAHPPAVRDRRAPCPVRLAQSCLSTYPPTSFGRKIAKVV